LNARKAELNTAIKGAQATKKEKVQRVEGLRRIFWAMGDAKREVEKSLGKVSRYGSKLKKAASLC
jgi:hypothetical protein